MSVEEREKIGQAAIEKVENCFTDKINAENVYQLYCDTLDRKGKK